MVKVVSVRFVSAEDLTPACFGWMLAQLDCELPTVEQLQRISDEEKDVQRASALSAKRANKPTNSKLF